MGWTPMVYGLLAQTRQLSAIGQIEAPPPNPTISLAFNVTSLSWSLWPGRNQSQGLLVTNNGTVPLQFRLTATDWVPSDAPRYLSFGPAYANKTMMPGESVAVSVWLACANNATAGTGFSFKLTFDLWETHYGL